MSHYSLKVVLTSALLVIAMAVSAAEKAPERVAGATTVSPAEAKKLFDNETIFIDVRGDEDFDAGRIPGAIQLSLKRDLTKESLANEIDKDEKVVFYCNGVKCKLSSEACAKAIQWGYTNVHYFRDGMPGWISAGYPVE